MSDATSGSDPRIGVIGVGHLGAHHARILNAAPGWNLTAIFDCDPKRNEQTAQSYDLPVCSGLDELLSRVDAISICTPTESHFEIAKEAMSHGRHVFVEKPVCETVEQANELVTMARDRNLVGAVGHIERFNPAINAIRERIGQPRFIEAHRLNQFSPRGLTTDVILELMIHDIDLARWLVGEEPCEIRAAGVPVLSKTDDIANCRLSFPSGCVANLTASRISANPMRKIRIFSHDHYTSVDLSAKSVESYRLFDQSTESNENGYTTLAALEGRRITRWTAPTTVYDALEAELNDFQNAVTQAGSPRVSLAEGAKSLQVALSVAQACREQAHVAASSSTATV